MIAVLPEYSKAALPFFIFRFNVAFLSICVRNKPVYIVGVLMSCGAPKIPYAFVVILQFVIVNPPQIEPQIIYIAVFRDAFFYKAYAFVNVSLRT